MGFNIDGSVRNTIQASLLSRAQHVRTKWARHPVPPALCHGTWVLWSEPVPDCADPPECGGLQPALCLAGQEPKPHQQFQHQPRACHRQVCPWSRTRFWEVLLLSPSALSGGGYGGGDRGPHLQWSVIIGPCDGGSDHDDRWFWSQTQSPQGQQLQM